MKLSNLILLIIIALSAPVARAKDAVNAKGANGLPQLLRDIQKRELGDLYRESEARRNVVDGGVRLGTWRRIGPFRDQPPLLNWMENVASSFAAVYEPQKDMAKDGGAPRLEKVYRAENFPATPEVKQNWTAHPEWIDGYLCDLPRGPAPSAGETQYVYREINAEKFIDIELEFSIRSPESDRRQDDPNMEHWRRQAMYQCWLNGKLVIEYDGKGSIPVATKLALRPGVNHFLAKITNNRHSYGFSFAVAGLHPAPRRKGVHERPWRPFESYRPGDSPYFRDGDVPAWYRSSANWREALFASAAAYKKQMGSASGVDIIFADFEGEDYGAWRAKGEAFGSGPARGAIAKQMDVTGFAGKGLVNTYFKGDGSKGILTSPPVKIERKYVKFLIGGGGFSGKTCVNLLVGDKVVRTAAGPNKKSGGSEALDWRSWDVGEFIGQEVVFQIVDRHTGGWGHINVDQITFTNREPRDAKGKQRIWTALRREFADAQSRLEIELTKEANDLFWKTNLNSENRNKTERALANFYLKKLSAKLDKSPENLRSLLGIAANDNDYSSVAREAYFTAALYGESLTRLKSFRSVHAPMPGIEAATRDSTGRVVTQMEADLESYPESPEGARHRARVEAIGAEIKALLKELVKSDEPRVEPVLALNRKIEEMWNDEIRRLPPVVFLERPPYRYDALQFTLNGSSPSYVRAFDPAKNEARTLFHSPEMRAHDMNLSWDAKSVFIGGGGKVAEIEIANGDYRVVTTGQSPAEMPNGRLVFFDDAPGISACKATGVRRLLFTVDRDGQNRKVVSANLTIDTTPQIMDDGRVVFCRWDYGVNKNVFNRHAIWVQNPDGTALDLFFGNTIIDPFAFYRPRQIPGRPEVLTIFGTHHNNNAGLVGLVWQGRGREGGDGAGFERITHDTASVGDACPHWAYQDPYPLNEQLFLVSYGGTAESPIGVYLLDRYGNKKCVYEPSRDLGAYSPQPLVARKRPLSIPSRVQNANWKPTDMREQLLNDPDWSKKATFLLQDVYRGITPEVERGRVKSLAVMEQVVHTTPRGGAIGVGTIFYVNRLIGLVPVEPDGSAHFEAPALRSLYFHALDKEGKMLMTMGSDMHAMPGENRSCIGCHEQRKGAIKAPPKSPSRPEAMRKKPAHPEMPNWGTNGIIEYEAVVQPVFDKYCVECHSGRKPEGNLDLSGSRTTVYNMSYMQLVDKGLVHFVPGTGRTHAQPSNDYDEQAPLSRGTLLSKITPYLDDPDHSGKSIPWEERFRVYAWIDANVPFYSHYRQLSPTVLEDAARDELLGVYKRRCASCHDQGPRKDAVAWLSKYNTWVHSGPRPGQWGIAESGMRVRHLNLTRPAQSLALQAPLAKSAGGLEMCVQEDNQPVLRDKDDPDYQRILRALKKGTVLRDQPGVQEILKTMRAEGDSSPDGTKAPLQNEPVGPTSLLIRK